MEPWQIAFRKIEKLFKRSTLVELREAIIRNDPMLITKITLVPPYFLYQPITNMCPVCYLIYCEGTTVGKEIYDKFHEIWRNEELRKFITWVDLTENYKELLMKELDSAIDRRDQ